MSQDGGDVRAEGARTDEQAGPRADPTAVRTGFGGRLRAIVDGARGRRAALRDDLRYLTGSAAPGRILGWATAQAQQKPAVMAQRRARTVLPVVGGVAVAAVSAALVVRARRRRKRRAPAAAARTARWAAARVRPHADRSGDVVDLLLDQHRQIKRAFRRATLPGPRRRSAFEDLVKLLSVHEAAEEAHVHPTVRRVLDTGRNVASSRREEEKQAKKLLVGLVRGGTDQPDFTRRLRRLRRAVLSHAAHEEREEFPALRRAVRGPRLRALRAEVRLTQALAPTRPHRWANNELVNKLATPVAGPFDRTRDAVRDLRHRVG